MPKKPVRNSFYFYMIDFKEEQRQKGINYGNMKDVADAAGPIWRDLPAPARAKYEAKAKAEKQKRNIPDQKYTSYGVPFAVIDQQEKEIKEAEENERKDIKNMVKLRSFDKTIQDMDFFVMDVNAYCKIGSDYFIGESTILRFSLREGIIKYYPELINPGHIPIGYAFDFKLGCQEYGLNMPDENERRSDYMQILANFIDFLKKHDRTVKVLPPIFVMPDKVLAVQNFIAQMCNRAGEDDSLFRVYRLDLLFFTLINSIKTRDDEGFPKESLALTHLKKDLFKYSPGLGCEHHESTDKSMECTNSRVKRLAFSILDSCCPLLDIEVVPGKHIPHDYDIEGIIQYKEEKRNAMANMVNDLRGGPSSSNVSVVSYSSKVSSSVAAEGPKKEKPIHVPLRMPKASYKPIGGPVPEMTDNEGFLTVTRHGRGRGLAGSLNKLKIDQ